MSTFHIDPINGADANSGADWANAWKTITTGATAARLGVGDTVKIAKSPDPISIGNGTWRENPVATGGSPTNYTITSLSNASGLIRVVAGSHGMSTGDIIYMSGVVGCYEANGAWKITRIDDNTFDLVNSAYVNARTSGGAYQKVPAKVVELADSTLIKNVTDCETGGVWTNAAGGDCTASLNSMTSNAKEGGNSQKLLMDAAPQANKLQAYFATGALDLSGFQQLSFWLQNSNAFNNATTWIITLCSDTAGATPVDTFVIPAIPTNSTWTPLVLSRTGGGNLGNNINSIAVSTGSTAPANSSSILLDNIIATTTGGLNHQSLISKNPNAQGGDNLWYPIQSISPDGSLVMIDSGNSNKANAGRGYYETTETVTTYIRDSFKTTPAVAAGTVIAEIMDSGTYGQPILFTGGWNSSNDTQDGETWFDGMTGNGYGLQLSGKNFITLDRLNFTRYNIGFYMGSGDNSNLRIINMLTSGNGGRGMQIQGAHNGLFETLKSCNGYNTGNITINSSDNALFYSVRTDGNANAAGLEYTSCYGIIVRDLVAKGNYNYGVNYVSGASNTTYSATTSHHTTAAFGSATGNNTIQKATIAESVVASGGTSYHDGRLRISQLNGDYSYVYSDTAHYEKEDSTLTNGSGKQWKLSIDSSARASTYPMEMPLANIAVRANAQVTFSVWFQKSHGTNITAKLVFPAQLGATEAITTCPNDTNENQLTVTFTPTEVGVVSVMAQAYASGAANVIIDGMTVSQA